MEAGLGFEVEKGRHAPSEEFDDDGRVKRTGTLLTSSAHIITAVIGSGVLSLAWAVAQLGWLAGPMVLFLFAAVTWFCSTLLVDCYRSDGKRNYTYRAVVKAHLRGMKYKLCAVAQYANLVGVAVGYTITTGISMGAVNRSNCFHEKGHDASCEVSYITNMIIFSVIQILLSQIPNFHDLWWLSIVAAVMSLTYSFIGLGLSIGRIAGGSHGRTTLTGTTIGVDVTASQKVWRTFQALGDIAFAYSFSNVLIEIEDTLKPNPPENVVMKKAATISVIITTTFYMLCGLLGYAAFGNDAPGNFLTGLGFYEPYWLIDIGNICVSVHLIGAYQVFAQPVFQVVEKWIHGRWPNQNALTTEHVVRIPFLGDYPFSFFRLIWRSLYVIITAVLAMIFPFFNDIVGLIGALSFWPLTVYFPIEMYVARTKTARFSAKWISLQVVSVGCLIVSLTATVGSIQGLVESLQAYKPH